MSLVWIAVGHPQFSEIAERRTLRERHSQPRPFKAWSKSKLSAQNTCISNKGSLGGCLCEKPASIIYGELLGACEWWHPALPELYEPVRLAIRRRSG
jgi:hypothetical protein